MSDTSKKEKTVKALKSDFFVLSIIAVIYTVVIIMNLFASKGIIDLVPNASGTTIAVAIIIALGIRVAFILINVIAYFLSQREKTDAGVLGIIISVFMLITVIDGNFVDTLLGVFLMKDSIKYLKNT